MRQVNRHTMIQPKTHTAKSILAIVLIIVALFSMLTGATWAWFYTVKTVDIDNIDVAAEKAENFMISEDGGQTWDIKANISVEDVCLQPISGNGTSFFAPKYSNVQSGEATVQGKTFNLKNNTVSGYGAISAQDLPTYALVKDYSLRYEGKYDCDLLLDSRTSVTPSSSSPTNPNFGDINTKYIAGAVRAALLENTGTTESPQWKLACIWIPNTTIEYDAATVSVKEDGTPEAEYSFTTSASGSTTKIATSKAACGSTTSSNVNYYWGNIADLATLKPAVSPCVLHFGTAGTKEMRLVVWVEGTDRECVNALSGGLFDVLFGFTLASSTSEQEE